MRTADTSSDPGRSLLRHLDDNEELGSALEHGLDLPLSALRASMESLNRALPADGYGSGALEGVLGEVERLGRNVRELMAYARPPRPMPMRCTLAEIAHSARAGLPASWRERVIVARDGEQRTVHVDAPLVAQCLRRLIENALEAGSDAVLLVARDRGERFSFTVVDRSSTGFDAQWALSAFHSTKGNHLGLGLALVERDVQLLGGELVLRRSDAGETSATILLRDTPPAAAPGGGSA